MEHEELLKNLGFSRLVYEGLEVLLPFVVVAGIKISCSCPTNKCLAETDEETTAQKNIEAGDLLEKSWDCLSRTKSFFNSSSYSMPFSFLNCICWDIPKFLFD